jgi:hypothetical protein
MGYIIKREESKEVSSANTWLLIYGRRKTGKTFLLRNLCGFPHYYLVKRDLSILSSEKTISKKELIRETKALLKENKSVVIDEFQRLKESDLEELTTLHPKGRLILSGSSLKVVKKIFEPRSPLLGFFTPTKIGFIAPRDIIHEMSDDLDPIALIEAATFIREPWLIPFYKGENVLKFIYKVITKSRYIITALTGEIFTEEERELTRKYEAILRLVGAGVWNTQELTSILYSRELIPSPSPTHIIQYLKNLEEMDLVESIKLHKSKKKYYRLLSSMMGVYYYLDSRYDVSHRNVSIGEIKPTLGKLMNMEIQNFVGDLFARLYEGRKEYYVSPSKEVDFIITKRNRVEVIGEVKWKKVSNRDLEKFKDKSEGMYGRRILICKETEVMDEEIDIIDARRLVSLVKKT